MRYQEIYDALEAQYPRSLSCAWDNDGMMVCADPQAEAERVLVALDATEKTLAYAAENRFDLVLTHHPMLFRGVKAVQPSTGAGRRVLFALRHGISVFSFHTRLDAAPGGVNDALCARLGYTADGVFGDTESPALGRLFSLPVETEAAAFAAAVKESLGCAAVRLHGNGARKIRRIAVCGGDGKDFVYPALAAGAELFLTGDAGYNMAGDASEEGLITLEAGHYHTEAPVCAVLAAQCRAMGLTAACLESCTYRIL